MVIVDFNPATSVYVMGRTVGPWWTRRQRCAPDEQSVDLSSLEIIATDAAGRTQRGTVRADGFFVIYLAPGNYKLSINPATLKPEQNVTPAKITLKVERTRIENLTFNITERTKRVRKTFSAKAFPSFTP